MSMRATLSSESSRHEARRENMVEVLKKLSCGNHGISALIPNTKPGVKTWWTC